MVNRNFGSKENEIKRKKNEIKKIKEEKLISSTFMRCDDRRWVKETSGGLERHEMQINQVMKDIR